MLKRVGSAARLVVTHPSTSFPRFRLTQNAVQSVEYITLCEDRDISLFSLPPSRELHVVWRDKGGDATMSLPTTLFSLSFFLLFDRAAVYHHQLLDTAARGEGNQRERERELLCNKSSIQARRLWRTSRVHLCFLGPSLSSLVDGTARNKTLLFDSHKAESIRWPCSTPRTASAFE